MMSAQPTPSPELGEIFRARLQAELARADSELPGADAIRSSGEPSAPLLLVKGEPGPAEAGGGLALGGEDGAAVAKALDALGRDPQATYAVLSRPVTGAPEDRVAARLRHIIETCDPLWVVALDIEAAEDIARALGSTQARPGAPQKALGRSVLALEGLEASLTDDALKRRVWEQLQPLRDD